jgi:hypothetical protein
VLKATTNQIKRLIRRFRQVWAEVSYAQRRAFEIRTGVPVGANKSPRISRTIDELDRLYAA